MVAFHFMGEVPDAVPAILFIPSFRLPGSWVAGSYQAYIMFQENPLVSSIYSPSGQLPDGYGLITTHRLPLSE